MTVSQDKTLTLVEVARLLFRTKTPSPAQVARAEKLMRSGVVRNCRCEGPPLQWTTTAAAVADYLADESLQRQLQKHASHAPEAATVPSLFDGSTPEPQDRGQLKSLYKEMWRDYFLSVFLRRKAKHRSVQFQRAVLAGQIALLAALVLGMASSLWLSQTVTPPEHLLVEEYIDQQTDEHTIKKMYPVEPALDGNGVLVRVQYIYEEGSSRPITTDRTFRVVDGEVSDATEYE